MKPLHDLLWLSIVEGKPTPIGELTDNHVRSGEELGDGAFELHWFGTENEARAFCLGVVATGLNSIDVAQGLMGAEQAVLLRRLDRERYPGQTLEEEIPLISHANSDKRRLMLIWGSEVDALRATSKNPNSSFTAAQISREASTDRMSFVFKYDRWETHPDFDNIQKGGVKSFEVIRRGESRFLVWRMRELSAITKLGRTRGRQFRDQIEAALRKFDGKLAGDAAEFPLNGDIRDLLVKIIPVYDEVYKVDAKAEHTERRRKIYETPQVQQVIYALEQGGVIVIGQPTTIQFDNKKPVKVAQKTIQEMAAVGLVVNLEGKRNQYRLADGVGSLEADPYEIADTPAMKMS